jgi:hypothetical protein
MFGRRRDERLWSQWEQMLRHGLGPVERRRTLVTVVGQRQQARSGLKAYLRFPPHSGVHAAWFRNYWPPAGASLVVTGQFWADTYATHHGEVVFMVEDVHAVSGPDVLRGWQRHQRRLERRQQRVTR